MKGPSRADVIAAIWSEVLRSDEAQHVAAAKRSEPLAVGGLLLALSGAFGLIPFSSARLTWELGAGFIVVGMATAVFGLLPRLRLERRFLRKIAQGHELPSPKRFTLRSVYEYEFWLESNGLSVEDAAMTLSHKPDEIRPGMPRQ